MVLPFSDNLLAIYIPSEACLSRTHFKLMVQQRHVGLLCNKFSVYTNYPDSSVCNDIYLSIDLRDKYSFIICQEVQHNKIIYSTRILVKLDCIWFYVLDCNMYI